MAMWSDIVCFLNAFEKHKCVYIESRGNYILMIKSTFKVHVKKKNLISA